MLATNSFANFTFTDASGSDGRAATLYLCLDSGKYNWPHFVTPSPQWPVFLEMFPCQIAINIKLESLVSEPFL